MFILLFFALFVLDFEIEKSMFTIVTEPSLTSFTYYPMVHKDKETTKEDFLSEILRSYDVYFTNNPHVRFCSSHTLTHSLTQAKTTKKKET